MSTQGQNGNNCDGGEDNADTKEDESGGWVDPTAIHTGFGPVSCNIHQQRGSMDERYTQQRSPTAFTK